MPTRSRTCTSTCTHSFFKLSPFHHIIVLVQSFFTIIIIAIVLVQHTCTQSFFTIIILEIVLVHWIRSWVKEIRSTRLSPLYTIVLHNYYTSNRLVQSYFTIIIIAIVLVHIHEASTPSFFTIIILEIVLLLHWIHRRSTAFVPSRFCTSYAVFRRTCHKI